MIRLIIVDDQNLFSESLKMVIENKREDIKILATPANGEEALNLLSEIEVDLILMDIQMPVMNGVQATKIVKRQYPGVKVIMLTTHDDEELVQEALEGGASGFLLKSISPQVLLASIDAVMAGSVLMSPGVAGRLMDTLSARDPAIKRKIKEELPHWYAELRPKERHIIKLMIQGLTNKEIADEIHVAPQTIRNYISRIYSVLEVEERRDAVVKARTIDTFYYE